MGIADEIDRVLRGVRALGPDVEPPRPASGAEAAYNEARKAASSRASSAVRSRRGARTVSSPRTPTSR